MREAWTTKGKNRLRKISCSGNAAGAAHHTHNLSTTRGIVWCIKCGGHTSRMPRTLRNPCLGTARSPAYRNVMQRLASGRLPTEGQERQTDSGGQREQQDWDEAQTLEENNLGGHKRTALGGAPRSIRRRLEGDGTYSRLPRQSGQQEQQQQQKQQQQRQQQEQRQQEQQQPQQQPVPSRRVRLMTEAAQDVAAKRRRIYGKQAATRTPSGEEVAREACKTLRGQAWIKRLVVQQHFASTECTCCGTPTKARCISCRRALCISCGKAKRPCP